MTRRRVTQRSNAKAIAQEINSAQASAGLEKLGVLVSWGVEGVNIDGPTLESLYHSVGLDLKWMPPNLTGASCFRKALREVLRGAKGYIHRPITDNDQHIVYGIVKEEKDEDALDLQFDCEAKVEFQKASGSVFPFGRPGTYSHDLANAVQTSYLDHMSHYVSYDIQRLIKRNIVGKMNGIPMRRGGGSYFVAPQHEETLLKFQKVFEQLGTTEISLLVLHRMPSNVSSVGRNAKHHLEDKLKEIKSELDKFKACPPTEGTLKRRLDRFKDMQAKVDMYANLLGLQSQALTEGLEDCKQLVRAMIDGGEVATITRKRKKKEDTTEEPPNTVQQEAPVSVPKLRRKRKRPKPVT